MTQTNEQKIKDAVRMVGHLLETNGTTGWFAKDEDGNEVNHNAPEACSWCLMGAMTIVEEKFGLSKYTLDAVVAKALKLKKKKGSFTRYYPFAEIWDCAAGAHKPIIKALKEIQ